MVNLFELSPNRRAVTRYLLLSLLAATISGFAQQPPMIVSPEVHPDRRATFRFHAPNAKEVKVSIETLAQPLPMQKDEQGVWSATTDPLEPDFYGYSFVADGVNLIDPSNYLMKPNLLYAQSMVHVPGPASLPWEVNDVPHGVIHRHFCRSGIVGDERDYYVYTPPGYDAEGLKRYPVLYLLHGYSDDASAWVAVGCANVILDNLIAQGKAKPMLVVMPLGYGAPEIVQRTPVFAAAARDESLRQRNYDRFRDSLLKEVIPAVADTYRVSYDRNSRAIAGLSMGGTESLLVGLNALDHFAWVGAFSSGGMGENYDQSFPTLDATANSRLRLLWVSCGVDDRLIEANRKFRDWLESKEIKLKWLETPGPHAWPVWRRNLAEFAARLFQEPAR